MIQEKHLLSEFLFKKADLTRTPIDGVFELTPICNMSCKMCYVRKSHQDVEKYGGLKTKSEWLELAAQAKKRGLLFLLLTGGEIFTYPDFIELYTELVQMGFIVSLNTNGTIISKEQVECLCNYPPRCVNITLYGGKEQTYQSLCNYSQGYQKAQKTIELLKEKEINVNIHASLTPLNIDDLSEICQYAKKLELPLEATAYMFPPVRKENDGQFIRFTAQEVAEVTYKINTLLDSDEEFKLRKQCYIEQLNYEESEDNRKKYEKINCRAGCSSFWITWDGKLLPCGMMDYPYGEPFRDGFDRAWLKVTEEIQKIKLSSKCAKCHNRKVCQVCAAKIFAETGKFDEKPQYICNITEKMNQLVLKTE